jgi:hypothetical protein
MATNRYFKKDHRGERDMLESLTIESIKQYGQDFYYLPRTMVNVDNWLGYDVASQFNDSYLVEMYIDNIDGYGGEGDMFMKFGIEIRNEFTLVLARKTWEQTVAAMDNRIDGVRPMEGDLIWSPLTDKLFELSHVEHAQPFFQLGGLYTYKMRCVLFEFANEDFDTGIDDVDNIEQEYAFSFDYNITMVNGDNLERGDKIYQNLSSGVIIHGEVANYNSDTGALKIINVGSNDHEMHLFGLGQIYNSDGEKEATIDSVIGEDFQPVPEPANDEFSTASSFLDFSESNPFGDMRNN